MIFLDIHKSYDTLDRVCCLDIHVLPSSLGEGGKVKKLGEREEIPVINIQESPKPGATIFGAKCNCAYMK